MDTFYVFLISSCELNIEAKWKDARYFIFIAKVNMYDVEHDMHLFH